ncbi:GNAT family N-acetyltransferase [Ilyomonas limi]|uniref:GNAT family N-acetyltransferase n=1 Tax=Ilyomonas limi TaxID=2575867 RepID=A0A4V6XAV1_9BACT|nr:GNAT family N-acetyltransferase [Ilyomonas limi]TKK68053.1 GNAT family N-acetyltransferase [Ilyomonas limi]
MQIQRVDNSTLYLVAALFDQYRVFYHQPSDIQLARQFLQQRLSGNESVIFVALDNQNGKTISAGFTQLYPLYSSVRTQKNWILNDLYVEVMYRKQGVGRKLIEAALQFAKEAGATFIQLETMQHNITAQRLYEAMGFEQYNPFEDELVYKIKV